MKRCYKCGTVFPATVEYFYRDNTHTSGLKRICKECNKETNHLYQVVNSKRIRDDKRRYWLKKTQKPVPEIKRLCSLCGDQFETKDGRRKRCPVCSVLYVLGKTRLKSGELYSPIDECYMHLLEEMVENCDVLAKGWHYEGHYKIPKVKFLVACKTCTIKSYCPNSNGQCKDLPVILRAA